MNKLKKRTLLLTLALSAVLLLPMGVSAQKGGGIFYRGDKAENVDNVSLMSRGATGGYNISTEQFGSDANGGYQIGTEQFGQDAPLGSGLFIMAAAGAAYALKKRKMNK